MTPIHPKVALPTIVSLGITAIMVAIQQYAPTYSPNPALTSAIVAFVAAITGYFTPSP